MAPAGSYLPKGGTCERAELQEGRSGRLGYAAGEDHWEVVEKLTSGKRVGNRRQKGTKVSASEDDPRYVVESDKTGKRAAHRPEALERRGS